jgi:hypothetical protein
MENPYAKYGKSSENPYAKYGKPEGLTLGRAAEVAVGEALPTAAAAGLGGLAGAALGVGALPAAALGATALGAAELGTSLYNIAAPSFGKQPVRTPVEMFQEQFTPSYRPQTPAEKVEAGLVGGALGGLTQARGANALLRYLAPETRGARIAEGMAAGPAAQTAAGAVGGAAPEYYKEVAGGENPYFQFGLGVLGGGLGGRAMGAIERGVTRAAPTLAQNIEQGAKDLGQKARNLRAEAYSSGAKYDASAYDNFVSGIEQDFANQYQWAPDKKARFRNINDVMSDLASNKGKDVTMADIHGLRKDAGAIFQNPSATDFERAMAHDVVDRIDLFRNEPMNAVPGGELAAAKGTSKLSKSIEADATLFRNADVQKAMTTAKEARNFATGVKSAFTDLKESKKFKSFTPEQQKLIGDLASGRSSSSAINFMAAFAPNFTKAGLAEAGLTAAPFAVGFMPDEYRERFLLDDYAKYGALGAVGAASAGLLAKNRQAANAMRASQQLQSNVLGNVARPPINYANLPSLAAAGAQGLAYQGQNAMVDPYARFTRQ